METIILRVVSKYLGLIVKNFTNEQAKLSLRKGEAALRDIEIDHEFFNKLLSSAAPMFAIERATCSEIAVKVPWTRLKHDPIEVHLGNIEVLISEHLFDVDAANAFGSASTVGVDADATRRQPSPDGNALASELSRGSSRSWSTASRTRKYGFIDKIIDGVRVDFDRLVIRLQLLGLPSDAEQPKSGHAMPDVLELVLKKGSFFQTDPAGDVVMLKQARSHFSTSEGIVVHKTFRCESVRVAMTRASGSCGYVHRFDVLEISPLVCQIKLRRLQNGELQRVLGIVPLEHVEVDVSAPQLESLMVAIMSLLHALYRQDPNGVPDNASDYAAAEPAPDNESLRDAYNELRLSASKRLFESYMMCSLPPLFKGCTVIDVSVRSLCVRVRDVDKDNEHDGVVVAAPASAPLPALRIDVGDEDAVVIDVECLNIGVVLPPCGSSIWPDAMRRRMQETVLSVVLQRASISAPEPIFSSKRDAAVRHHVASLDEPFPSSTNKTALDIKITSRWPRPAPPVLSTHVDVRANLISLLADPDICLRAAHTLMRPLALNAIRRFNELNTEQDNIHQLVRVELNGIHVCVPVPIPSALSTQNRTASEFVASVGTLRVCIGPHLCASAYHRGLVAPDSHTDMDPQQHATELYLNAGEVRLLPLEWATTGLDDAASMGTGTLADQLLLRIETARLLSVQREQAQVLHKHTSGFVERLVLETNAESLSCVQSVVQWIRMALGDSELVNSLQIPSGDRETNVDAAADVSHTSSVQVCRLALRNDRADECARLANANQLTLIVEHSNERTDVNLSCEVLEVDLNRERDNAVNAAESTATVYMKPFAKLSCEHRDNGRSIFIQVAECGDDAPLRHPTTPTGVAASSSSNGGGGSAALFTLSEFRNELNEMASALQNFVRIDSGALLVTPTSSRVAAARTGRVPVTPSTKAAIIRFSQALALGDDGTMGSPLHAERMIEMADTPHADQQKLTDAVYDDKESKTPSVRLVSQATPTTQFPRLRVALDVVDSVALSPSENVSVEDTMPCDHRMRLKDLALSELKNSKSRRFAQDTGACARQESSTESAELVRSRVIVDRLRARNRILNTQLQMLNSRLSMALDSLQAERSRASEEKQMIIGDFSQTQEVLMNEVADLHLKLGAATKRLLRASNTTTCGDSLLE